MYERKHNILEKLDSPMAKNSEIDKQKRTEKNSNNQK